MEKLIISKWVSSISLLLGFICIIVNQFVRGFSLPLMSGTLGAFAVSMIFQGFVIEEHIKELTGY